jgi:hypothetical protein
MKLNLRERERLIDDVPELITIDYFGSSKKKWMHNSATDSSLIPYY